MPVPVSHLHIFLDYTCAGLEQLYILLCCPLQVNIHNSRAMCLCCRAHFIVSSSMDNLAVADNLARRSGSLKLTSLSV